MIMKVSRCYADRYQTIACLLFAVACAGYLIAIYLLGLETEVMFGRFVDADQVWNGEIPDFEYPPFALVFMIIPRIFASTPFWYNVGFVIEMFVFMVIGLVLISKLADRFQYDRKKAVLIYTIFMLLMFQFIVDRYDIIPAVFVLASFYCITTKRYGWAFALLALGAMTKLYPVVLFPIYALLFIMDRDWKWTLKGTAVFAATSLATIVPVLLTGPELITNFFDYHMDRPLQIESIASSFIYPFSMIGLADVGIEFGFGSDNLIGPLPDAVASILTPLMVVSITFVYLIYAHALHKEKERDVFMLGAVATTVLLLFITVGKVFSAQYLIWVMIPLIFLFMTSADPKFKRTLFALTVLSLLLTQLVFAYNIGYLGGGANIDALGMMIILARNLVVLTILCYLLKQMYVRYSNTASACPEETASGR